ncbi:MAG: hypothetical protein HQL39_16800, partial [Alphaproteobacteria bacterium]|nr:hypothetical protein [Alphaproteobacteria bacterium]
GLDPPDPIGGSASVKRGMGAVADAARSITGREGAPIVPANIGERYASRIAEELGGAAGFGVAGKALATAAKAGRLAMTPTAQMAVGSTYEAPALQAASAGGAGLGAGIANEVSPNSPIAEMAGALAGGATVGGLAAAGAGLTAGAKAATAKFTEGGRERIVGDMMRRSSANPNALAHTLGDVPALPGAMPSTAEASGDIGLAALERALRASNPAAGATFASRDAANNQARRQALDAVAPGPHGPEAVAGFVRGQRDTLDGRLSAVVDQQRHETTKALDALGGMGEPADYGRTIRDGLESARAAAKATEAAAWSTVDPEGTVTLDMPRARTAGRAMLSEIGPLAAPPGAEVKAILDAAASLPESVPFQDLQQFRSRITSAMREAARAGTDSDARRLAVVLDGVTADLDTMARPADAGSNFDGQGLADRYRQARDLTRQRPACCWSRPRRATPPNWPRSCGRCWRGRRRRPASAPWWTISGSEPNMRSDHAGWPMDARGVSSDPDASSHLLADPGRSGGLLRVGTG